MNSFLWVLQILLALYNIAGGVFLINNNQQVTTHWAYITFPQSFWLFMGIVQVILAIGLVLPRMKGNWRNLNAISAFSLAILLFLGNFLYVAYQGFPGILWGIVPAIILVFVGYQRMGKK